MIRYRSIVRIVLMGSACLAAAATLPGCTGTGTGSTHVGYSYGAYYGDPWGPGYYYGYGRPVYVGPPVTRPPSGSVRPPHPSPLPAHPMPPPRPMPSPRPAPRGGGR